NEDGEWRTGADRIFQPVEEVEPAPESRQAVRNLFFRDVGKRSRNPDHRPIRSLYSASAAQHPDRGMIGVSNPVFKNELDASIPNPAVPFFENAFPIRRVDCIRQLLPCPPVIFFSEPQHLVSARGNIDETRRPFPIPESIVGTPRRQRKPFFAFS